LSVGQLTKAPNTRPFTTARPSRRAIFLAAVKTAVKTGRVARGAMTTAVKTAAERQR